VRGLNGNFLAALQLRTADRRHSVSLAVPGGPTLTYGDLYDLAEHMAAALAAAGAKPGDRVLVLVDKSASAVALYLACLGAGAVHVPLNPAFTLAEVGYFTGDCEPAVIVTTSDRADAVGGFAASTTVLTLDADGSGTLTEAAESLAPLAVVDRDGHDLAALVYTSGTTGRPKGSMVSHAGLRHNAEALCRTWGFSSDDVLLHSLPIFHVHGLFVALHCAMLGGMPIHLLPRFDVGSVIDLIPRSTVMMGVPTHYFRLMADPRFNAELCEGMRLFTSGSAPLPAATFEAFEERTGHRLCERYGMSEAGIITSNPYDGARVAGTVGFPLTDYELRITDQSGCPTSPDVNGMVEIRGPDLCSGYWKNPAATSESRRDDGWFITGDVGRLDTDGRLTLEGRAGDMIISGGENLHPIEIEAVLDRIDCIVESAVVGVPHPDFGEVAVAVVVTLDGTELDHRKVRSSLDRHLAPFKHPKVIEVVAELPRNAMGKVRKNELRDRFGGLFAPPTA